ncbi:response regulator transcription factor [Balneolaceae bacterium YR4-1]|uniref:Response regulator transcription factor n=1 Tax=Halalkalibaculum roseum TaxID=2709311 RepID=A0A6M1SYE4_9BACT|nr:response regulator transcription factor [Halalkalibaculum roseum]NGP77308.1 response regulator transcription factor [Halalkalibaculum roseum]
MAKIKVLIADDHEILRFGISTFLNSAENIDVVGEASSGDECIELFKEKNPDVCVLDISMPGKNGIETTKAIREIDPNVKVLILSMHIDKAILDQVLEAGINGYLLKDTEKTELLHGIESIAKGQQVFSDPIQKLITKSYLNGGRTPHDSITSRELEVLQLIVEGYSSKLIADKLNISPRTVDTHRGNIMQKLNIPNAAGLVRYAMENDLVSKT